MSDKGWIKIDRSILDHWLWKSKKPFDERSAWIDLILLANYKDTKIPYKGEIVTCERGSVNLSISFLAKRWGWSRDKAMRFISILECDQMCTLNATRHRTTIKLMKYDDFQNQVTTNKATNKATNRQPVIQQADNKHYITKESNKESKEKKESAAAQASPSAINPDDLPRDKNGCRPLTPEEMKTRMAKW